MHCCHAMLLDCFSGLLDVLWMLELGFEVSMLKTRFSAFWNDDCSLKRALHAQACKTS